MCTMKMARLNYPMGRFYYGRKVYTVSEKREYWEDKLKEKAELDAEFKSKQRRAGQHNTDMLERFGCWPYGENSDKVRW